MSEKVNVSAGGLLDSLRESFNWGKKKPTEAPAVVAATPTAVPTETPTPADFIAPPEPTSTMMPSGPTTTETPAPVTEFSAPPDSELPDWLQGGKEEAEVEAPLPEAEAPAKVTEAPVASFPNLEPPIAEFQAAPIAIPDAPSAFSAAEAEKNPEQLAIEQFEEALLKAKKTMTGLLENQNFKPEELTAAMAAAAVANGLIPKLPEHYLEVLLASRILGEQHNYTRMDFQESMSAAIKYFMKAQKG